MSKTKLRDRDISKEYDFSDAKRGVFYQRAVRGIHVVHVTDEEVKVRRKDQGKRQPKR